MHPRHAHHRLRCACQISCQNLASGMTVAEVLDDFPYLTETDIRACLAYAADREKSQMVVYANETPIRSESIAPTRESVGESVS